MPSQRASFFPKADASVLQSRHEPPSPSSRPTLVGPVLDVEHAHIALDAWSVKVAQSVYPSTDDPWAPAPVPDVASCPQSCSLDRYLFPVLTRDERLRLTMLFYYTRGILEDQELMSRLQEKVMLARETVGWEFVIAGLLNHNTYTRMVTVGLPLAILPRRESTCAHTVNQPPGIVFSLLNMTEDWRFKSSPHVEHGGLRSYAGVPLRFETEFGQHVAFGSLCVASNSPQEELSKEQQRALARLADWIVADIVHSARQRRQRERKRMQEALAELQIRSKQGINMETAVIEVLESVYPNTLVQIHATETGQIALEGGAELLLSELEHGLWEDHEYFDFMIENMNHKDMVAPKSVRVVGVQCISQRTPTFLIVSSRDFREVFDDVDSWFASMCASMLCRYWQDQALHEARTAKETFMRGITHQLRTPIHGILGSVELLTEELRHRNIMPLSSSSSPNSSPIAEQLDPYVYIRTIRSSARELISTVNSLIKLNQWTSIAEAERDVQIYEFDNIESLIANEIKFAIPEDTMIRPTLIFSSRFKSDCDSIAIDARLFIDCIQPLIVNAIQNTPKGVVAVTFTHDVTSRTLVVDVEDNGCGIPIDDQKRIFEAYRKVESTRADAAGLGLTLACKSAALLSGTVMLVDSKVGQGSYFQARFDEQVYASSWPRKPSWDHSFIHLPATYREVSSVSSDSLLMGKIGSFLESKGISRSDSPAGNIVLLEYSGDMERLYRCMSELFHRQVAICVVPEEACCSLVPEQQQIYADKNFVYARGPFSSNSLQVLLLEADKIAEKIAVSCSEAAISEHLQANDTIEVSEPIMRDPLPNAIETELTKSIRNLGIEASKPMLSPPPRLPHEPKKPMALLVDDNVVNLRLLELYCSRRGIPYRAAKDGNEAVKLFCLHQNFSKDALLQQPITTQPFDVVLMDLQMPACDGLEATRQIRDLEEKNAWQQSIICMVTGQDSPSDRNKAVEVGADWYLVKPVGPKILDRWMKKWFPGLGL